MGGPTVNGREGHTVGRKSIFILAVVVFVGALSGVAMTDVLGESSQSGQVLLAAVAQEYVPEGNRAGTNWQGSDPVETAAIPVLASEEPWMKEYGND
jgi:hypothetical protein